MRRKIIYFSPRTQGFLADFAWAQAEALSRQGVDLIFLTRPSVDRSKGHSFRVIDALKEESDPLSKFRWLRGCQQLRGVLRDIAILRGLILSLHVKEVIWGSFIDFGAPFWLRSFHNFDRHSVRMGVIVEESIQEMMLGASRRRQKSIVQVAALFKSIFIPLAVHKADVAHPLGSQFHGRTVEIPHGFSDQQSGSFAPSPEDLDENRLWDENARIILESMI